MILLLLKLENPRARVPFLTLTRQLYLPGDLKTKTKATGVWIPTPGVLDLIALG